MNQLSKEGKLTTRRTEDRAKPERPLIKDTMLHQAAVCLQCKKKKCIGSDRCFSKDGGTVREYSKNIPLGKTLAWTEEEIVRHYNEAKDKTDMIGILADLNNVSTAQIKEVLKRAGIKLPKRTPVNKPAKTVNTGHVTPRVFYALEHDGRRYSIDEVQRICGRSRGYVVNRIKDTETSVIGGVEYNVIRYTKRMG